LENGRNKVFFDDTGKGEIDLKSEDFDLIVLSTALIPPKNTKELAEILSIELDQWGFYKSLNPLISPTSSTRQGIYLAGCCLRPKDITFSVIDASSASAKALESMNKEDTKNQEVPT
jgi:heterodisulfide reductase subunit A